MRILIDTREQTPFTFTGYDVDPFKDLRSMAARSWNRFERELARGRHYDLFMVVVETSLADVSQARYRSDMKPQAPLQSIITFQVRYRVPFVWAGNRTGAEYLTYSFLAKHLREIEERYKLAVKTQDRKEKAS